MRTARATAPFAPRGRIARTRARLMPVTSSSSKPDASASRIVGETTIHKERWLTLTRIDYVDPEGTRRQWDAVRRSTTTSNAEADAARVRRRTAAAMRTMVGTGREEGCALFVKVKQEQAGGGCC